MNPEVPKGDNLQVRSISREVDLAWLAGIIDGEGNLDFSVQEKKSGQTNKHAYFCPKVRITNTDVRMCRKIAQIYKDNGIVFFYTINSVNRYKNKKPTWKNQMEVSIGSQGSVAKLLKLVLPYLANKQALAQLMLETIEWVQAQPYRGRMSRLGENYSLKPEFHAHIESMKAERAFYIEPSTTKRKAGEVIAW